MKRCPQCEFTFDDHQEYCDFDGAELSVLPEFGSSVKNLSLPGKPSSFGRIFPFRVALAGISVAVVILSALLIGYYDAATSPDVAGGANSGRAEKLQLNKSSQGPSYASMQRRVTSAKEASSMPSSTIDWLADDSESEPADSGSTMHKAPATAQANTRGTARPNRQSRAGKQRVFSRTSNTVAQRKTDRNFPVMRRQKNSKVVALLKKTGSILTWPFRF